MVLGVLGEDRNYFNELRRRIWGQVWTCTLTGLQYPSPDLAPRTSILKGETSAVEAARKQIKRLKQNVGELVLDLDILQTANRLRPTDPTTFDD